MGGEKQLRPCGIGGTQGSPPRGRGKENPHRVTSPVGGITPAWAGKSKKITSFRLFIWDHPRVGGEKWCTDALDGDDWGSPPRGRGKVV